MMRLKKWLVTFSTMETIRLPVIKRCRSSLPACCVNARASHQQSINQCNLFQKVYNNYSLMQNFPIKDSKRQISYGIFAPNEQSNEELISYGNELLEELKLVELSDEDVDTIRNSLSGILYQLYIRNEEEYLMNFFNQIIKHDGASEAAYNIVMRYYSQKKDAQNVKRIFNMLKGNHNIQLHSRSYVPLTTVSLRLENYEQSFFFLNQMIECLGPRFKENNFHDIMNTCNELVTPTNYCNLNPFVLKVFKIFEDYGSNELSKGLVESITSWFMNDPVNDWHVQNTSIGKKNGMCQFCKKRLNKASISAGHLLRLKRNLLTLVKASIVKKENYKFSDLRNKKTNLKIKNEITSKSKYLEFYDTLTAQPTLPTDDSKMNLEISRDITNFETLPDGVFDKLGKLRSYLDSNGPFDMVIDVLNIGYFTLGFNPVQVRNIVDVFIKQGKRILILCAGGLREELLTSKEVPAANRRRQQLLFYLNRHCSLFFVGSSFVDDYYILYTLIHHNFDIELVSRDLFRDHLFHLDADNTADFQRWQQKSQYILKAFKPDGSPVFKSRMDFHIAMQHHEGGWHIPIANRSWLCVSKISNGENSM